MTLEARQAGNAKAGAGAENGDRTSGNPWNVGSDAAQIRGSEAVRGIGQSGEVVDQMGGAKSQGYQLAFTDLPVAVREAHFAVGDRAGNRERDDVGNVLPINAAQIVLQCLRESSGILGKVRPVVQPCCEGVLLQDGETRMRAANVPDEDAIPRTHIKSSRQGPVMTAGHDVPQGGWVASAAGRGHAVRETSTLLW